MKGRMAKLFPTILIFLFLSACTGGRVSMGNPSFTLSMTEFVYKTRTPTIVPPTPTSLPTVIPVGTPTEGLPPDLELFNTAFYGNSVIGEIRNNTDTTMVFPIDSRYKETGHPILRISIEAWEWDGWETDYYYYDISAGKGSISIPNTNCFLYPGETGVIIIRNVSDCRDFPENCIKKHEEKTDPPEHIGMRLIGYQDLKTYTMWQDLYHDYHPQAGNLVYEVTSEGIEFNFDLPKSFFKGYRFDYTAWILLYDENGGLINILFNTQLEKILVERDDKYIISGFSRSQFSPSPSFFWSTNYTLESLGWDYTPVDHIRVFVEEQHEFLCGPYTNYDYYDNWVNE